jgi:integrase
VREAELSAESINKTLILLGQVLDVAVEYDLLDRNPAVGRRRRLRVRRPARSYLDTAEQIGALLDAAGELDGEAREDRQHVARRVSIAVRVFAGLRLGELLALRWRDVDLGSRRLLIRDAKTAAGVRHVTVRPVLLDVLTVYSEHAERTDPDALVFASDTGRRFGSSNYRRRVLTKAIERADKRLKKADRAPLPEGLTPQSLRRTFASLLYATGESPPVVMAEMGHTDPKLALFVYAQAMRRGDDERGALEALMAGEVCGPMWTSDDSEATVAAATARVTDENPADSGASDDGRGWFRTSDLSRVKRALSH